MGINEDLFDASNRHQIYLIRFGGSLSREVVKFLDNAEKDLVERIKILDDKRGPEAVSKKSLRLKKVLADIKAQNRDLIHALNNKTEKELLNLAQQEIDIADSRINQAVGVDMNNFRPSPEVLKSLVKERGLSGKTLGEWWSRLGRDRLGRLESAVSLGVIEGDTTPEIVRRFRQAENVTKKSATALVRTHVNHVANQARGELYKANDDIIKGVRWTSTLDGRTSEICMARDGKAFDLDEGPRPPAHPNCRSITVPITKSWEELGAKNLKYGRGSPNPSSFFQKQLIKQGFDPLHAAAIVTKMKKRMDGLFPEKINYNSWLKKQPIGFIEDVLGPTKTKLFLEGGLHLDRFVDDVTKKVFSIDEIRDKNQQVWMHIFPEEAPDIEELIGEGRLRQAQVAATALDRRPRRRFDPMEEVLSGHMDDIAAHPKSAKAKAFEHLKVADEWDSMTTSEKVANLLSMEKVKKQQNKIAVLISQAKKRAAEGKPFTPKQLEAIESLSEEAQKDFYAQIDEITGVKAAKDELANLIDDDPIAAKLNKIYTGDPDPKVKLSLIKKGLEEEDAAQAVLKDKYNLATGTDDAIEAKSFVDKSVGPIINDLLPSEKLNFYEKTFKEILQKKQEKINAAKKTLDDIAGESALGKQVVEWVNKNDNLNIEQKAVIADAKFIDEKKAVEKNKAYFEAETGSDKNLVFQKYVDLAVSDDFKKPEFPSGINELLEAELEKIEQAKNALKLEAQKEIQNIEGSGSPWAKDLLKQNLLDEDMSVLDIGPTKSLEIWNEIKPKIEFEKTVFSNFNQKTNKFVESLSTKETNEFFEEYFKKEGDFEKANKGIIYPSDQMDILDDAIFEFNAKKEAALKEAEEALEELFGKTTPSAKDAIAGVKFEIDQDAVDFIEDLSSKGVGKVVWQSWKANNVIDDLKPGNLSNVKVIAAEFDAAVKAKKKELADAALLKAAKKNIAEGKKLTKKQQAVWDAQPAAIKEIVEEAATVQKAVDADDITIPGELLEQIGAKPGGSVPGFLARHKTTGDKWIVKTPASEDITRNEVLAAQLYKAAGVEVPELRLVTLPDGRPALASKVIDSFEENAEKLKTGTDAHKDFAVDAWLANHDAVGMSFDNIGFVGGKAIRIDVGGALRYRAQGGIKQGFDGIVDELESMRDARVNWQTEAVFGNISKADLESGVSRIIRISDETIDDLVKNFGPADKAVADRLAQTLKDRRDFFKKEFPHLVDEAKAARPPITSALAKTEIDLIRQGRANGYVRKTDKDLIEDNEVLIWEEWSAGAKQADKTGVFLKVRLSAADALDELSRSALKSDASATISVASVNAKFLEALKGMLHRNFVLEKKDYDRAKDALKTYEDLIGLVGPEDAESLKGHFSNWKGIFENYIQAFDQTDQGFADGLLTTIKGIPNKFQFDKDALTGIKIKPVKAAEDSWTMRTDYERKIHENGHLRVTGERFSVQPENTKYREIEKNGVIIRYWSPRDDIANALRNQVEIIVDGVGEEALEKAYKTLDDLKIPNEIASSLDLEETYLKKHFFARKEAIPEKGSLSQEEYIKEMQKKLSAEAGYDITKSPNYLPEGFDNGFGNYHKEFIRADSDKLSKRWDSYIFLHRVLGKDPVTRKPLEIMDTFKSIFNEGGHFSPKRDFFRRGKDFTYGGISPGPDMREGGAAYLYTTLKRTETVRGEEFFSWNPQQLAKRLDARNHTGDLVGRLDEGPRQTLELNNPSKWDTYETVFKNGISLFRHDFKLVLKNQRKVDELISWIKGQGEPYSDGLWPDGRKLEEVITTSR